MRNRIFPFSRWREKVPVGRMRVVIRKFSCLITPHPSHCDTFSPRGEKGKILSKQKGFTLLEVLLALAVIAIALAALLKVTAQNIETTNRVKEKTISHFVAMQGIAMIQLNLIQVTQNSTQATKMLGQTWYWRAAIKTTPIRSIKQARISVSLKQIGPFKEEAIAYVYSNETF